MGNGQLTDKMDSYWSRTVDVSLARSITCIEHVKIFLMDLPNINRHGIDTPNFKFIEKGH